MRHVDNPFQSPSILSLCTGMRGLERGLERVIGATRTVAYVEIEAFTCENLVQQMEQGVLAPTSIWTNIKTFPAEQFYGKIHGITGGYPCQPFSEAGLRKGENDERHLWPFIKRIVKKSRPIWCFFENVEGHLSLGFDSVQKDLRQLGYQVEAGLFSAAEVGAPHRRTRLFILALENSFVKRVRGWSDEQRENWKCEIQTQRSSQLANSDCNADSFGLDTGRNKISPTEGKRENKFESRLDENGERIWSESIISSKMANTNGSGLQGWNSKELRECRSQVMFRSSDSLDLWPAYPNEQQFKWEEPRTESRMVYAINGYNFREDLLRMAGNGVVEQTAELAFRTLLGKFGLNC